MGRGPLKKKTSTTLLRQRWKYDNMSKTPTTGSCETLRSHAWNRWLRRWLTSTFANASATLTSKSVTRASTTRASSIDRSRARGTPRKWCLWRATTVTCQVHFEVEDCHKLAMERTSTLARHQLHLPLENRWWWKEIPEAATQLAEAKSLTSLQSKTVWNLNWAQLRAFTIILLNCRREPCLDSSPWTCRVAFK